MIPIANRDIKAVYVSEISRGFRLPTKPRSETDKIREKLWQIWKQKAIQKRQETEV